ncbi:diacylglycerol kinase eta isoform X3 [Venturia canescens]|uniref:diacylglycerol kinase eta isoform X3 n=1 Tax=Venturia canescens TaxID=32260 RepID=UPI001C9CD804|nr:diacylglycerol kinase eta isoform X3 [Venturia canescens]
MESSNVPKTSNWPAVESDIHGYVGENNTAKGKRLGEVETTMRTTTTTTTSEVGNNKDEQAESSGSEAETEPARSFHRKLSTNRAIKNAICWTKEGFLMKQTWSFQRWRRRYFKLRDRTLYYAKDTKDTIFDEIELTDLTLAECSTKNANHSFQVITPFRSLVLCGESRQDMEEWLGALRTAGEGRPQGDAGTAELLGGNHHWYATSHARPTYCNVCRDALYGVTSHGLSCEVCKYKVHKRCSTKAINNCKWTTLASIGKDIIEDQDGNIQMPHQWMEGNLPVSSKCFVCDKTCGSVLRLQDWRCLWCRTTVHTACRPAISVTCPLGPSKLSVVPPTALHSIGSDEAWEAVRPNGCSPLLVFVNSKSGDNQGIKFLRRFKQLLNPAQVFDLINGGPGPGLRLFRHFDPFRILVCSGDGSVGWVLSEIDRLGMHKQCQVGVLPLGTGNDLARVLGWGASCDDDTHLPQLLEKYEKAGTKMLDRWSIMTFQRSISLQCRKMSLNQTELSLNVSMVHQYEDNATSHIANILQSDQDPIIISSAKVLCETVKDFATRVLEASMNVGDEQLGEKCVVLQQKLDLLLQTLNNEENCFSDNTTEDAELGTTLKDNDASPGFLTGQEKGVLEKPEKDITNLKRVRKRKDRKEKEAMLARANSLKRAIRQLVEHTELVIDDHNNPGKGFKKAPNITVTDDTSNTLTHKKEKLELLGLTLEQSENLCPMPTILSANSMEISPCPSPTPNLASLSPMPDLRRDSQAEEMLTLPAPDGFADSRRNSSNLPSDGLADSRRNSSNVPPDSTFNFMRPSALIKASEREEIANFEHRQNSEPTQLETPTDVQITVTSTTLDTSSRSDDTTIQDALISPDSDSSANISTGCIHRPEVNNSGPHTYVSRSSCSNSIVSSDSLVSDTLDSKSCTVKNSESEIGHIDSDILDSTKRSEMSEMGHIDSPENSEMCASEIQTSESMIDDLSSLGQDLISTMLGEKYDSVRECIEYEHNTGERARKYCSLAQFVEGNDIARRSFKRPSRYTSILSKENSKTKATGTIGEGGETALGLDDGDAILRENSMENERTSDLLNPVCCFNVTSDESGTNENDGANFPPAISVIVDPPSPSMSIESRNDLSPGCIDVPESNLRRYSGGSMEKLSVELPETGFSPQATRRISSGSLLKASEVVSLAASTARLGGSNMSLRHDRAKSVDKSEDVKKLPIINPLVQLPMWPNVSGGAGLISQALLANADALCAAVSPLMDPDETLMEGYFERCVMNNYFGIGIDAKISLDFHHKREEHPEKCRSRAKNYMWYGVLGSKQWLQKTYKNLEQRVQLECDGQRIPLPSLQGIVVLNIPSFMGGTNFWGGTKEGDLFLAPSFDDRILEVVAVFGSVQMAASRLINLQHHRIAQCQTVQINILGEEGVPIQVDGEAWIQPPGMIRIIHKNRMQMLYRNRALETSLRAWEEKQRSSNSTAVSQSTSTLSNASQSCSRTQLNIDGKPIQLYEEEHNILIGFIEVVTTLVKWVKLLIISHPSLEPDLYQIADRTAVSLEKVHPEGKIIEGPNLRPVITDLVSNARQLYEESCELLRDKAQNLRLREDLENKLSLSLAAMEQELRKCVFDERGTGMVYLQNVASDDQGDKKNRHRGLFWLKFRRSGGGTANQLAREQVTNWSVQDVCVWLENLQLGEYTEKFVSHDIRGRELLTLARRDLKELGIIKVGHVKRILQAINDLNN